MRVLVDQDRCCASGQCVIAVPSVFDQRDEDGVVVLLDPSPPREVMADVQRAVHGCPSEAIAIEA
jgi:ferredoxin